jgi:hypothetical protein
MYLTITKEIRAEPASYNTEKYQSIDAGTEIIKHSFFKSKVKREFIKPHEGPSPGDYNPGFLDTKPFLSSSFKSVANRFKYSDKRTPGPGTYDPISVWINSKQADDFSCRGVFFAPSAKIHS